MMKNKKELLIIALIGIFIIIIGYLYVIRPIFAFVYFIPEVYDGVELYFDKKYIDFDDGKAFEYALSTVPFLDDEKVVAFEYHDNKKSDDLFRDMRWFLPMLLFQLLTGFPLCLGKSRRLLI